MLRAFFAVFAAMFLIVGGDTAGKILAQRGFDPLFIAWSRFALAALVLLPFSGLTRAEWLKLLHWPIVLRAGLIAAAISCIMTALKTEPIADVFGAFFIGPVVSYVLSALLLGERVTLARSGLLAIGFIGVLLVVRPGFGGGIGLLWALAAGCLHGSFIVSTRWLAAQHRPRFMLISQLLIGSVLLAPLGVPTWPEGWSTNAAALVTVSALASAAGNFLLVLVSRTTPAGIIAPLIYTQLIAATTYGVAVFGQWPDAASLFGLCLIGASGVFSLLVTQRERKPNTKGTS